MEPQNKLSSQMEDYLEAIYLVCKGEGVARIKSVAGQLGVSYPSVVGALKNLKRRKLVQQEHYGYIRLTEEGQKIAGSVSHRHEVLAGFFMDVLGLDQETASKDACKVEHDVSYETLQRLRAVAEFIAKNSQKYLNWKREFQRYYGAYKNKEKNNDHNTELS